jgi:hypothetical protein
VPTKKEKQPISVTHPEIANEAEGWDPSKITAGSNKKLKWMCPKNHIWEAIPNKRCNRGDGCPYCSGKRLLIGFNDLASTHPDIARESYNCDTQKVTAGSNLKREWICQEKQIWSTSISHRTSKNATGCPICSGHKILPGKNDLKTLFPHISKEVDGWDPTVISPGSNKHFRWKCSQGHKWKATLASRTSLGTNCPVCANQKIVSGINDLETLHPQIAKEADGWNPRVVAPGSDKKQNWKCKKGHRYNTRINKRTLRNQGCPICANKKIVVGINDLQTTHPLIAEQAFGWDPTTVNAGRGSKKISEKLEWKCGHGHIWKATPANRTSSNHQSGCPSCAVSGYKPDQEGYLYFLKHEKWKMFQIGITNFPKKRLATHKNLGWELLELRGPMDGHLTQQWETAILRMLKAKGADLSNSEIAGKFDGYSEAWSQSTFEAKSIKKLMKLTEEFEEE